ncbi:hypothetical protein AAFF_G00390370 [Aldrovandia affinis]|uniref:Uncharacterized protein n=1 Tax=Aldrovandia affinis TaxID=143900 RepID=A0AAD7SEM0_9TELE|nr:hypothetical protein AAFF_G00390370 [Aldrovandia affinis]
MGMLVCKSWQKRFGVPAAQWSVLRAQASPESAVILPDLGPTSTNIRPMNNSLRRIPLEDVGRSEGTARCAVSRAQGSPTPVLRRQRRGR